MNDSNLKNFALIVLNYDCFQQTIKNIDLLIENNTEFKIIIVDNKSPDNDFEKLEVYYEGNSNVEVVLATENGGYSKGNNLGIYKALELIPSIEYIAIMNPDVKVTSKNIFTSLIERMNMDSNIAWIAPLMIEKDRINFKQIGWELWDFKDVLKTNIYLSPRFPKKGMNIASYDLKSNTVCYDVIQGSLFIIRREVFEKLNFFDENVFMYYEENILSSKIKDLNSSFRAAVALDLFYIHEHDFRRKTLKQRKANLRMKQESANYYIKYILKTSKPKQILFKIVSWFNINVEISIVEMFRRVYKWTLRERGEKR